MAWGEARRTPGGTQQRGRQPRSDLRVAPACPSTGKRAAAVASLDSTSGAGLPHQGPRLTLPVAWRGREHFHLQSAVVRAGGGTPSQELVCLGRSRPAIRSLTSGPGSSHSGNTSLEHHQHQEVSPRCSLRPRRGQCWRQGGWMHSPVRDAASEPWGCCICHHGNSTGRKGSGPGLAIRPHSRERLTTLACFLGRERGRASPSDKRPG